MSPEDVADSVSVAEADTDLASTVVDLWVTLAEGQRTYGSHLLPEENRTRVRESIIRHAVAGTLLVARDDDAVVGFVTFEVESGSFDQDCTRGIVENLYVCPEYRGEGIGTVLVTAAEQRLAARGVDAVALEVMADNESARQFYRDRGYAPHRVELEKPVESDTHSKDEP